MREGGRGESYARITRNVLLDFGGGMHSAAARVERGLSPAVARI